MRHEHERHARVDGKGFEELCESVEAAGGRTDTNNGKWKSRNLEGVRGYILEW
jgi:hypothetical protein